MTDDNRRAEATTAANVYAPRPEGSYITYGFIAAVIAMLVVVIFGLFYTVEVLAYPGILGAGLVVAFALGVLLRRRRKRLHKLAFAHELESGRP